jgi:hypothetical protein
MIAKKYAMLITLGACVLGLSVLGSTKNPVTRPLKSWGHATVVISFMDGSFDATIVGHGTLTGASVSHGVGTVDPSIPAPVSGHGTVTAANGDKLYWEVGPGGSTVITGGTGRFEGATGSLTETASDMVVTVEGATMTLNYTSVLDGTLTY